MVRVGYDDLFKFAFGINKGVSREPQDRRYYSKYL